MLKWSPLAEGKQNMLNTDALQGQLKHMHVIFQIKNHLSFICIYYYLFSAEICTALSNSSKGENQNDLTCSK